VQEIMDVPTICWFYEQRLPISRNVTAAVQSRHLPTTKPPEPQDARMRPSILCGPRGTSKRI
jgi:hypothetical protein